MTSFPKYSTNPNTMPSPSMNTQPIQIQLDQFLVCGLGSLGQHCVSVLKQFGVNVSAIDLVAYDSWEIEHIPDMLDTLLVGDCRNPTVLEQINVSKYRAILLVTSDDRVNIEAAFAARSQNPEIRLVVRSAKDKLNSLLTMELGNFVAFEPSELSAPAFALSAIGEKMPACFNLEDRVVQVIIHDVEPGDALIGRTLSGLNINRNHVLAHWRKGEKPGGVFYKWSPNTRLERGDTLVYMTTFSDMPQNPIITPTEFNLRGKLKSFTSGFRFKQKVMWFLHTGIRDQIVRVAMLCALTILMLLFSGAVLFRFFGPEIGMTDAFFATMVLLLGGYPDLLGSEFEFTMNMPPWLRLFGLGLTLIGTVFVGVIYALMTQSLISTRLKFKRRPPVPKYGHVVVIGIGMVGRRILSLLSDFGEFVVSIKTGNSQIPIDDSIPQLTASRDDFERTLKKANLDTAGSVIAATRDEMDNLEMALMAQQMNPSMGMVIRTYNPRFSGNVDRLFPCARVLCVSELAAEAFAAAAFGEKVPQLFRLNDQTIIVTEYNIEDIDTLHGLLLAEIAYGYGVVPILHQRPAETGMNSKWMPTHDLRLRVGDRLFVLATTNGLRRIELGELFPRTHEIYVNEPLVSAARFEGANIIARGTGCEIARARELMQNLPARLPDPVYHHQGHMIIRALKHNMIDAKLIPIRD